MNTIPETGTPSAQVASPIADLTYRNYDGPLLTRAARWWIVALANIRLNLKKPGFWITTALCFLVYIIFGLVRYIQAQAGAVGGMGGGEVGQKYATTFFQAYQAQALFLFILALIVGTGSIAADNRANALLVYLSKPITKGDYLFGKWMSIFLLLFAVTVVPALLLYGFFVALFFKDGILTEEPLLLLRILGAMAFPAAIYASLLVGISAWSKTGRMAGGVLAGVYFVSLILVQTFSSFLFRHDFAKGALLRCGSLQGLTVGLAQNIYNVTIAPPPFAQNQDKIPPPAFGILALFAVGLIVLGVAAARAKIKAVEVIRG